MTRVGRRPVYMFGAISTAVLAFPLFRMLDTGKASLVWLGLVLAFLFSHAAMYAPQAALLSEMFATRVRYSGASLGSQLASVLAGGLSPLIGTALLDRGFGGGAISAYLVGMSVVTIVAVAMATETLRHDIHKE